MPGARYSADGISHVPVTRCARRSARLESVQLTDLRTSVSRHSDIDSSYAWVRLAASVALGTIGGVGMWTMPVVLSAVQAEFGVLRADASLPFTLTMLGFACGGVVMGALPARLGILARALLGMGTLSLGFFAAPVPPTVCTLALRCLLMGVGGSAT